MNGRRPPTGEAAEGRGGGGVPLDRTALPRTGQGEPLDAARRYLARGWQPIPVPSRSKAPRLKDWQQLRLGAAELPRYFAARAATFPPNIGVLLGAPSGGLVDVDLDAPVALQLADRFLPPTDAVFGRPSKPRSHRLYRCDPAPPTTRFQDVDGAVLVELRANGTQVVVPPSVHPSGELVRWDTDGEPATIDAVTLQRAVRRLAAAAVLARHWPAQGSRHAAALALSGGLLRAGWDEDEVEAFLAAVADAAGDDETRDRVRTVASSAARLSADRPATGLPRLAELIDARAVERAATWLALPARAVLDRQGVKDRQHNGVAILRGVGDLSRAPAEIRPRLLSLATVRPEPVRWLWPGRIPLGKLTILDGDPGLGKSLLAIDLAARVSTGRVMPDGSRGDLAGPASVVLLSAEDDPADTIRPRLDAAGGDPSRVAVLTTVEAVRAAEDGSEQRQERGVTLLDIEALRQAITSTCARLVVIDPLMAFVGKADAHVDAEMRQLLRPLAELAQETGAAVLVIRHLNKTGAANPLYRGGGSIGIIGAARAGLLVARDPDDETGRRVVLATMKSNLAELAPALVYGIEAVAHDVAEVGQVPRIAWQGESQHTARSLLAAPVGGEERSAVEEAKAFLRDLLAHGPVEANRVRREARQAGISDRTLDRAKRMLGVRSVHTGFGSTGAWQWTLPPATASIDTFEGDGAAAAGAHPAAADLLDPDGPDGPDADPAIGGGPVASADTGCVDRQNGLRSPTKSAGDLSAAGDLRMGTDAPQAAPPPDPNTNEWRCPTCGAIWDRQSVGGACPACCRTDGLAALAGLVLASAHLAGYPDVTVGVWRVAGAASWAMFARTASAEALDASLAALERPAQPSQARELFR